MTAWLGLLLALITQDPGVAAFHVDVVVVSDRDRPVRDVEVLLFGSDGSDVKTIARGSAAEGGAVRLARGLEELASFTLLARAPGYRWKLVHKGNELDAEERIVLERGRSLHGRILDANGEPVRAAYVHALVPPEVDRPRWTFPFGPRGEFFIDEPDGGPFHVIVLAPQVGVAALARSGEEESADLGDLLLTGPASIVGAVTFPGGGPVAGVLVQAVAERATREHPERLWRNDFYLDVLQDVYVDHAGMPLDPPTGLLSTKTVTDDAGRFVLTGLAPGRYFLESPCLAADRTYDPDQHLVATGASEVALTADLRRLELHLTRADGSPPDKNLSFGTNSGQTYLYPTVPGLVPGAGGEPVADLSRERFLNNRGDWAFWIEPGTWVIHSHLQRPRGPTGLLASVGQRGLLEARVEVEPSAWHQTVDLVEPWERSGSAELRVTGAEGEVYLRSPLAGRVHALRRVGFPAGDCGAWLTVPAGEWIVAVGDARRAVELTAGERHELTLEHTPSARLQLALSAPRFVLGSDLPPGAGDIESYAFRQKYGASVCLVARNAGPAREVGFETAEHPRKSFNRILPGEELLSSRYTHLPPGEHVLWIHRVDCEPLQVPVTLAAGETTRVEARLVLREQESLR